MQVRLYRNLSNGKISIMDPETGLVRGHADSVTVKDVDFIVNEAGRQRVLREKQKNVHAFVEGQACRVVGFTSFKGRTIPRVLFGGRGRKDYCEAKYNPYECGDFTNRETGEPIKKARSARVNSTGLIEVWGPGSHNPWHYSGPYFDGSVRG